MHQRLFLEESEEKKYDATLACAFLIFPCCVCDGSPFFVPIRKYPPYMRRVLKYATEIVLTYATDCLLAIALKKAYARTLEKQHRFKTVYN